MSQAFAAASLVLCAVPLTMEDGFIRDYSLLAFKSALNSLSPFRPRQFSMVGSLLSIGIAHAHCRVTRKAHDRARVEATRGKVL